MSEKKYQIINTSDIVTDEQYDKYIVTINISEVPLERVAKQEEFRKLIFAATNKIFSALPKKEETTIRRAGQELDRRPVDGSGGKAWKVTFDANAFIYMYPRPLLDTSNENYKKHAVKDSSPAIMSADSYKQFKDSLGFGILCVFYGMEWKGEDGSKKLSVIDDLRKKYGMYPQSAVKDSNPYESDRVREELKIIQDTSLVSRISSDIKGTFKEQFSDKKLYKQNFSKISNKAIGYWIFDLQDEFKKQATTDLGVEDAASKGKGKIAENVTFVATQKPADVVNGEVNTIPNLGVVPVPPPDKPVRKKYKVSGEFNLDDYKVDKPESDPTILVNKKTGTKIKYDKATDTYRPINVPAEDVVAKETPAKPAPPVLPAGQNQSRPDTANQSIPTTESISESSSQPLTNVEVETLQSVPPATTTEPTPATNIEPSAEELAAAEKKLTTEFTRFDQQCVLLRQIRQLLERPDRKKQYDNFMSIDDMSTDDSISVGNYINGSNMFREFVNIPTYIQAALVPKIRLFKTYIMGDGKTLDLEIPTEEHITENDILSGKIARSFGYGLESFQWENTSFNEMDRNISATLTMKFSSMDAFARVRKGILTDPSQTTSNALESFSFMELIYHIPSKVNSTPVQEPIKPDALQSRIKKQETNYRFKVKVAIGWDFDEGMLRGFEDTYGPEIKNLIESIRANNIVLFLYNKGHDISFEQDGKATVTINYQSAQEARMNDANRSNILGVTAAKQEEALAEQAKQIEEAKADETSSSSDTNEAEQKHLEQEASTNLKIYQDFLDQFFKAGIVKVARMSIKQLARMKAASAPSADEAPLVKVTFAQDLEGSFTKQAQNLDASIQQLQQSGSAPVEAMTATVESLRESLILKNDKENITIPYFHMGDLLDIVLKNINSAENDKDTEPLKIITGPFVYNRLESSSVRNLQKANIIPTGKKTVNIETNIADIPVSFEFFMSWFEETIVSQKRRVYTMKDFLSTLLNTFIVRTLSPNCYGKNFIAGNPKVETVLLNLAAKDGNDPITGKNLNSTEFSGKLSLARVREIFDQYKNYSNLSRVNIAPYVYLQVIYSDTNYIYQVNEIENAKHNIYHLKLGVDRGIVKGINFSKDDNQHIPAYVYSQQGSVNPRMLRTPYNAEATMYGNTVFKPGSLVYIDPTYMLSLPDRGISGGNAIEEIGLGGFYIVTKTSNKISSGNFSTSVSCKFTNYGVR